MADEKLPNYNKEERGLLKQSRLFQDLIATEGWKMYQAILNHHIETRKSLLTMPIHALPGAEFQNMDFASRAAQLESVKGALIGLTLARDLPSLTINQSKDTVRDHQTLDEKAEK